MRPQIPSFRISLILPVLLGLTAVLSACNTFEGLGKDIQGGGQTIEKAADRHKSS